MNVITQHGTATSESISAQPAAIIRVKEKETTSTSTTTTDANGQPSQTNPSEEVNLDNVEDAGRLLINTRVKKIRPLVPPQILEEEIPLSLEAARTVLAGRAATSNILNGKDDRLMVVVGPCSVHDPDSALAYARMLRAYAETAKEDLHIVMRVYFEKPRTTVGWKGLINDPEMNGTFAINKGLKISRSLLLSIAEIGLPSGCEFLDTITPQYTADLVSWGAIGARTTESQVHRELVSALSMPTGFKNSTDGSINIAIDACRAARSGHVFLSVGREGLSSIVETEGNPDVHIILRGGTSGPNYSKEHVEKCVAGLKKGGVNWRLMIDCSHGNSLKQHARQSLVAEDIAQQLESSETGDAIMGVMIESNLVEGRQDIPPSGRAGLKYGVSVTDACIAWGTTVGVLDRLRAGVRARRERLSKNAAE
ncbi:putative 3-deoxy-D-arabino-heptulosonate 7-phosphate synthase isoenzyme [Serendipita vermifera]|nr:putative 3-deoxy-D-arabino-heptulosonate 7-phosphate synthase isoenzyme [Serendipita vermifera]